MDMPDSRRAKGSVKATAGEPRSQASVGATPNPGRPAPSTAGRSETTQAVRKGLASADRGEGLPMDAYFDDMESALGAKGRG
jgi:hypothetical protein